MASHSDGSVKHAEGPVPAGSKRSPHAGSPYGGAHAPKFKEDFQPRYVTVENDRGVLGFSFAGEPEMQVCYLAVASPGSDQPEDALLTGFQGDDIRIIAPFSVVACLTGQDVGAYWYGNSTFKYHHPAGRFVLWDEGKRGPVTFSWEGRRQKLEWSSRAVMLAIQV